MPLFHVHGLIGSTMATLLSGGRSLFPQNSTPLSFWRTVREHHVTWYSGVPTMHQLLLARTRQKPRGRRHRLRFIRSCSAPLSSELIHKIEGLFGVPFVEAYGMTEAAHQMTSNPLPPRHSKAGSVGSRRRPAHQHHGQGRQSSWHRTSGARSPFKVRMYFADTKIIPKRTPAPL